MQRSSLYTLATVLVALSLPFEASTTLVCINDGVKVFNSSCVAHAGAPYLHGSSLAEWDSRVVLDASTGKAFLAGTTDGAWAGMPASSGNIVVLGLLPASSPSAETYTVAPVHFVTASDSDSNLDQVLSLAISPSTGETSAKLYIAGHTTSSLGGAQIGSEDCFVVVVDADTGVQDSASHWGTPHHDEVDAVVRDEVRDQVYAVGHTRGEISQGEFMTGPSGTSNPSVDSTVFVMALSQPTKVLTIGTQRREFATSAVLNADEGHLYIAGSTQNSLYNANQGATDAFIARVNVSSSPISLLDGYQWGALASESAVALAIDVENNALFAITEDSSAGTHSLVRFTLDLGSPVFTVQFGLSGSTIASMGLDLSLGSVYAVGSIESDALVVRLDAETGAELSLTRTSPGTSAEYTSIACDSSQHSCFLGGSANNDFLVETLCTIVSTEACQCKAGSWGEACESQLSSDCDSSPCANGGKCSNLAEGHSCACATGWIGDTCETVDVDECVSSPCQNGGWCEHDLNSYRCVCVSGWTGDRCQQNAIECLSFPCQYGGVCTDLTDGYVCWCDPGTTGTNCETNLDECVSSPCHNDATCVDGVNEFSCTCVSGWSGDLCQTEVDECASTPCRNGGTCLEQFDGFTCQCTLGFSDAICSTDVDLCLSNPCVEANTEECMDTAGDDFNCLCHLGSSGTLCETRELACTSNPCHHDGTCSESTTGPVAFECACKDLYIGATCSETKPLDSIASSLGASSLSDREGIFAGLADVNITSNNLGALADITRNVTDSKESVTVSEAASTIKFIARVSQLDLSAVSENEVSIVVDVVSNLLGATATAKAVLESADDSPALLLERLSAKILGASPSCSTPSFSSASADNTVSTSAFMTTGSAIKNSVIERTAKRIVQFAPSESFADLVEAQIGASSCTRVVINAMAADAFFQGDPTVRTDATASAGAHNEIASSIITVTFADLALSNPLEGGASVRLRMETSGAALNATDDRFQCVAWNFTTSMWSSEGCAMVSRNAQQGTVECECTHLTNFAVLFDVNGNAEQSTALSVLSYVGVALALIGSCSVCIVYLLLRKLRTRPLIIIMMCCATIFMTELMFLIVSVASSSATTAGCFTLGLIMHYAMLAQFTALLCVGIGFYRLLHSARQLTTPVLRTMALAIVLAPLVVISIFLVVLAILDDTTVASAYVNSADTNTQFCFVSTTPRLAAVVMGPVALVLLINMILCVRIVLSLRHRQQQLPAKLRESHWSIALSLAMLLGITWVFAVFVVAHASVVFQYLFVIANGALGIFLFVNYVLIAKVRVGMRELITSLKERSRRTASTSLASSPGSGKKSGSGRTKKSKTMQSVAHTAVNLSNSSMSSSDSSGDKKSQLTPRWWHIFHPGSRYFRSRSRHSAMVHTNSTGSSKSQNDLSVSVWRLSETPHTSEILMERAPMSETLSPLMSHSMSPTMSPSHRHGGRRSLLANAPAVVNTSSASMPSVNSLRSPSSATNPLSPSSTHRLFVDAHCHPTPPSSVPTARRVSCDHDATGYVLDRTQVWIEDIDDTTPDNEVPLSAIAFPTDGHSTAKRPSAAILSRFGKMSATAALERDMIDLEQVVTDQMISTAV